jgi:hypothetical protein
VRKPARKPVILPEILRGFRQYLQASVGINPRSGHHPSFQILYNSPFITILSLTQHSLGYLQRQKMKYKELTETEPQTFIFLFFYVHVTVHRDVHVTVHRDVHVTVHRDVHVTVHRDKFPYNNTN